MYLEYKRNKDEDFENLCLNLNKEKYGQQRSVSNWKRVFGDWESKVKAKARRLHYEQQLTGGGIVVVEILTDLEKILLEVLSKILIYGLPQVIELGFKEKKINNCTYKTNRLKKKSSLQKKTKTDILDLDPVVNNHIRRLNNGLANLKNSLCILNKALTELVNSSLNYIKK